MTTYKVSPRKRGTITTFLGVRVRISIVNTTLWIILISGFTQYRRGTNLITGQYVLDYSSDGGLIWETLLSLNPSEDSVIIDSGNLYRHRIVGTQYRVDNVLTPTGYAGTEDIDWVNLYST